MLYTSSAGIGSHPTAKKKSSIGRFPLSCEKNLGGGQFRGTELLGRVGPGEKGLGIGVLEKFNWMELALHLQQGVHRAKAMGTANFHAAGRSPLPRLCALGKGH